MDNNSSESDAWRLPCQVPKKQEVMKMFWRIWPLWLLVPVLSAADLPITEVTLYKHGVAHLERSGELSPGKPPPLNFNPNEMTNALRSFTVETAMAAKSTACATIRAI